MLRAAVAKADITPKNGEDLCGFAKRVGPTAGISDPLSTRWLCLENSSGKVLLGTADIISLTRGRFESLQKGIAKKAKVEASSVCVGTSHTHSGPATVPLNHCGHMDTRYVSRLMTTLTQTAGKAGEGLAPVSVRVAQTQCPGIAINRRRPDSGPVDHTLTTIAFENPKNGKPVASIVHFACHPVVLGHENVMVSADFPGFLCSSIEQETGAPCLFLNGACGDINPAKAHSADPQLARRTGEKLAQAALSSLQKKSRICEPDSVKVITHRIALPVHVPKSAAYLVKQVKHASEMFNLDPSLFDGELRHWTKLLEAGKFPSTVTIKVSAMTLGREIALVFVPGEVFCEIGLRAKAASAFPTTLICGFSNGSVGYLPTSRSYKEGGYEPLVAHYFYRFPQFDPKIENVLVTGLERLLVKAAKAAR